MSQTNVVPGARFCSACGGALPGPVPRCPRCGAVIAAQKKSSAATIIIVVVACGFLGIFCLGTLAAIAIPNFLRYQLRAKEGGVRAELSALVKAELFAAERNGHFVPLGPLPSGPPNSQKVPLSGAEREVAAGIDWMVEPATHGQYRVAVAGDEGGEAASLCAEADVDGDGTRAVHVAFLPLERDGAVVGAPPAPCTEPVPYDPKYDAGQVITITGSDVF